MSNNGLAVWTALDIIDEQGVQKRNLVSIFYELAERDNDFNGENNVGEDNYNWEETIKGGFKTNCDYLIDEVLKDVKEDEYLELGKVTSLIDKFLSYWTRNDSYYDGIDFEYRIENNTLFVAVAVSTD